MKDISRDRWIQKINRPKVNYPTRPLEGGNIDLNNRPVVRNSDGSVSTLDSFSINEDGREVLLPSIVNGRRLSQDQAIDHYRRTGEHLGIYDSPETASMYAQALHRSQEKKYR